MAESSSEESDTRRRTVFLRRMALWLSCSAIALRFTEVLPSKRLAMALSLRIF